MSEENKNINQLEAGTYEIIQGRLQKHKTELLNRLNTLNDSRKDIFGAVDLKLIGNKRINTENNCIARDIIAFGDTCLLGYNVHIGLRSKLDLADVFSAYYFSDGEFKSANLDLINDDGFINDFQNLYKYYRDTIFARFAIKGNYLHMVFQISEKISDIKTFKWLINENQLTYVDNRSDHEYGFPNQHEFEWVQPSRDMHRYGLHAHVSILDKVFVETIGGDLTIKIEDNTDDGKGIYDEPVEFADQTLDDAEFYYADLGNLIILKIKPYQEDFRYFVYNHKVQEVYKIDSIKDSTVLLPENQGILFPNGYYLQTGTYKLFEKSVEKVKFLKRLAAPNGEDFIFVFYEEEKGDFLLIFYNIIDQEIKTPIICNGYTVFPNGELTYFRAEDDATKHHVIQIWQTPFTKTIKTQVEHADSLIYKIGNKDIVRAMAESRELIGLLNKEDSYDGLYDDISKLSKDIVDSYYWIREEETSNLAEPIEEIETAANTAIDEFEKVLQLKKQAQDETQLVRQQAQTLFDTIKHARFTNIKEFVEVLAELRKLRGVTIGLKDIRYTEPEFIEGLESDIIEKTGHISKRCVDYLLDEKALTPYHQSVLEKQNEIEGIQKVIEGKNLEKEVDGISADLELLIDIVNNLDIEDTSHSTTIIDSISSIFSELNKVKADLKRKMSTLGSAEAQADFTAQIKLFDQSVVNALDLAITPDKCDEYLTKLSVQLEEVEGKFAEYDEFVSHIIEKREEVYSAFDGRKNTLIEKRNKRALTLFTSAERILKGVEKKSATFKSAEDIHAYFASDLMISKIRDLIAQLQELNDSGKAEQVEAKLKMAKEESIRKLKDKLELYEDGENVIKLGQHKFGVNHQPLDLNIIEKENRLFYHLSGSDFYEEVDEASIMDFQDVWNAEYNSENKDVYRGEYLAYKVYQTIDSKSVLSEGELQQAIKQYTSKYYTEGYTKGVHDGDALHILKAILQMDEDMGLLKYSPINRGCALWFWNGISDEEKQSWKVKFKSASAVLRLFPDSESFDYLISELIVDLKTFYKDWKDLHTTSFEQEASYLFKEFTQSQTVVISGDA
ncbi:MAG: DNA repair ATPase, partial [Flavobacteriales bacterium]